MARVTYTHPHAGVVGATAARFSGTGALAEIAKRDVHARARRVERLPHTAQRRRAADRRLRARPRDGEWLQQATLAIHAGVPLDALRDTIEPFPTFSEIYAEALKTLHAEIVREPVRNGLA